MKGIEKLCILQEPDILKGIEIKDVVTHLCITGCICQLIMIETILIPVVFIDRFYCAKPKVAVLIFVEFALNIFAEYG